ERRLDGKQGEDHQAAEYRAHADRDREIATGSPGGYGGAGSPPMIGGGLGGVGPPGRDRGKPGHVRYSRTGTGLGRSDWVGGHLDLEELGFLVLEQLVHLRLVGVSEIVELALGAVHLVLARVAVLHHLVQRVLGVPPDVPDRDAAVL